MINTKKGQSGMSTLQRIILVLVSLAVITLIIFPAFFDQLGDNRLAHIVCKTSVIAKEQFDEFPLWACQTQEDITVPGTLNANRETVKHEISEMMVECKKAFGESGIEDPFKQGNPTDKNCFICHIFDAKEAEGFTEEEPITVDETLLYLFDTPHITNTNVDGCTLNGKGGYCEDTKEKCARHGPKFEALDSNKECGTREVCCSSGFECLDKGGICQTEDLSDEEYEQWSWRCPSGKRCFVHENDYLTYMERFQYYRGESNVVILSDIEPGETYAVSYGAPSQNCGYGVNCEWLGAGAGAGAVAIAAHVGTGGLSTVALGLVAVGGVGGYITAEKYEKEIGATASDLFGGRSTHTIYLTTLDQALEENRCSIVSGQK